LINKGACSMAWYASAIGHRSTQPAGLQIGSRVGRRVHGGHARIGKVNRRSNHYFINQHAHGQQRAVDYSSPDDNNLRCIACEHPAQQLSSSRDAQAIANATVTQCRAGSVFVCTLCALSNSEARERLAVVLIAGLVSAKWAALTTAPRYRTLDLPQACKPAFSPALCLACLPQLISRRVLGPRSSASASSKTAPGAAETHR
jgi:hypothetical protein